MTPGPPSHAQPLRKILFPFGGELPVGPIQPIIRADAEYAHRVHNDSSQHHGIRGIEYLAILTGINPRRLVGYATGVTKWISVDQADKYLCATGRHLRDLWPWLYSPEQIAADVWATTHPDEYRAWRRSQTRERDKIATREARTRARQAREAAAS